MTEEKKIMNAHSTLDGRTGLIDWVNMRGKARIEDRRRPKGGGKSAFQVLRFVARLKKSCGAGRSSYGLMLEMYGTLALKSDCLG